MALHNPSRMSTRITHLTVSIVPSQPLYFPTAAVGGVQSQHSAPPGAKQKNQTPPRGVPVHCKKLALLHGDPLHLSQCQL